MDVLSHLWGGVGGAFRRPIFFPAESFLEFFKDNQ